MVRSAATPRLSNHVAVGCAAIMTRPNRKMRQSPAFPDIRRARRALLGYAAGSRPRRKPIIPRQSDVDDSSGARRPLSGVA